MRGSPAGVALTLSGPEPRAASHLISLAKAVSWRMVATLTTAMSAYAMPGETDSAVWIGGIEFFLKIGIYYAHERLWLWLT